MSWPLSRDRAHRLRRTLDGLQVTLQRDVALQAEFLQPFLGERLAGAFLDQAGQMGHRLAEEDFTRLCRGQRPATLGQHFGEHAGHQRLGIDQHAVTVEQHGIEGKTGHLQLLGQAVGRGYPPFSHSGEDEAPDDHRVRRRGGPISSGRSPPAAARWWPAACSSARPAH
ncbi:hypothetical protein G6F32_014006 [Rhizopus arrhizus]|nr:hypothetical protein G6F32_014006 [Rhizopus arrhizus]